MHLLLPVLRNWGGQREPIALSAINQYLFCPRRAALIHLEGIFEDNEHTIRGEIVHEHADLPGYEVAKGVLLWRALPVWSDRLGLNGKCDIVEVRSSKLGARCSESEVPSPGDLFPVEFKLGKRRQWENDDVQLCAQALCLEEMFGVTVPRGAIFHADSKRRREVEFTAELRRTTEEAVEALHALLGKSQVSDPKSGTSRLPAAVYRPACKECSLHEICLPEVSAEPDRLQRAARALFETRT